MQRINILKELHVRKNIFVQVKKQSIQFKYNHFNTCVLAIIMSKLNNRLTPTTEQVGG